MSSSIQAMYDDEDDWDHFCKSTGADTRWKLYSREYSHAKKQHREHGYTNRELKLAVAHAIQRDDLARAQANEWSELKQLMELEKKYV